MIESEQRLVSATQRKKKNKNSKRFSDEQINSMETIFKVEAKLEPRKKLQMARELGLQPRQVAIWFQNKRARWKSKQTEQEFRSLNADYNELDSRFHSLKKENHSLLIQIQKLRDQLNITPSEEVRESKDVEGVDEDYTRIMYSYDELDRRMNGYDVAERDQVDEFYSLSIAEQVDGYSEATAERISGFKLDDDGLFDDQTCATPTWWDFWI